MNDSSPWPKELLVEIVELAEACVNEVAAPEQIGRLDRLLIADPRARDLYVRYMATLCSLHKWGQYPLDGPPPQSDPQSAETPAPDAAPIAAADRSNKVLPAPEQPEPDKPASPVLGFLGGVADYVNHSRRLMFLLVFAALTGWFVIQVGSVLVGHWLGQQPPLADNRGGHAAATGKQPGNGGADKGPQAHGSALAWLSGSISGRWEVLDAAGTAASRSDGGEYWANGTEFTVGQRVKLVAGLAEITFRSGAKLVLTGPTEFSVRSASEAHLRVGKLTAKVPHTARGFTVGTPSGNVVDLGTEFGVEVTPDKKLDVQVFVGEVKVNAAGAGDDGGGDDGDGGDARIGPAGLHVKAGQTMHLGPQQPPTFVASKPDRFIHDLELHRDSRDHAIADYLELMRKLQPVIWYRMEGNPTDRTDSRRNGQWKRRARKNRRGPRGEVVLGRTGQSVRQRLRRARPLAARRSIERLRCGFRLSQGRDRQAERCGLGLCREPAQIRHDRRELGRPTRPVRLPVVR